MDADGQPDPHGRHNCGGLHLLFGSIGFGCLIATCFVIARAYNRRGQYRAAVISTVVGIVLGAAFAGIATGAGNIAINLGFTAAIVVSYAWLTALAVDLYRRTRLTDRVSARSGPSAEPYRGELWTILARTDPTLHRMRPSGER
jgi:hypothetical protein